MEIDRLILHLCNRLKIGGHNHIDYTPRKKLQSILGSNGSGKTFLLLELSPQPANKDFYERGGYKKIFITSNNSKYELTSDFTGTSDKFWFKKDGVDLNTSGTISGYKVLVEREFGITAEIHRIQVGIKTFTDMSVAERRSIFTMFADMGYEYAFSFYRRLKDQLREIQATIKHQQNRLIEESKKFLSPEDEHKLREEVKFLKQFLNDCLELKHPVTKSHTQIESEAKQLETILIQLQNHLVKQRKVFVNKEGYSCISEIDNELYSLQTQLGKTQALMEVVHTDIDNSNKTLSVLRKENLTSLKDLDNQLNSLDNEVLDLISRTSLLIEVDKPEAIFTAIENCSSQLYAILNDLPPNPDKSLNKERLTILTNELEVLKNTHLKHTSELASMKKHLEHLEQLKNSSDTVCPRCQYSWKLGFHKKDYESVEISITNCMYLIEATEKKISDNLKETETQREYLINLNLLRQFFKSQPALNSFWNYIINSGIIYTDPKKINSLLTSYYHDVKVKLNINQLQKRRDELLEVKRKTEITETTNSSNCETHIQIQNDKLYKLQKQATSLKQQISTLTVYKKAISNIEKINQDIKNTINKHSDLASSYLNAYKQSKLNELIKATQLDLVEREQAINRTENQRSIILNIEHQIEELKRKQKLLFLAEKELSPSEGIIAKNITGFINQFINQINIFIENVWTYPIKLVPIKLTDENSIDLDYRFEVQVMDSKPIPDISEVSKGQKEIINLAFKVVFIQYSKLERLPLYLDELGANFDKMHQMKIGSLIQTLSSYDNFSQVFVVSHYSEVYGSFQEVDTVILCSANIVNLPDGKYNEVISFEEETV